MAHLIGSVEVGKKADLLVFDTLSPNLAGALDPFQAIVFSATNADVELVMVDGEIVKRDGTLTRVEWGAVAKELREKARGVRKRFPLELLEERWGRYYQRHCGPMTLILKSRDINLVCSAENASRSSIKFLICALARCTSD